MFKIILSLLVTLTCLHCKVNINLIIQLIKEKQEQNWAKIEPLLNDGEFDGFFTIKDQQYVFHKLGKEFQNILKQPQTIGYSHMQKEMKIYPLTLIDNYKVLKQQNGVLIDALHHAREPMSLHMLIYTYIKYIYLIELEDENLKLQLKNTVFWFLPVVNPDSYQLIYDLYKIDNKKQFIRKNQRDDFKCPNSKNKHESKGVDLNRNYGYKFNYDQEGASNIQCQEDYRGPEPFSEPETQAIKNFLESAPNIKVAFNLHAWGPLWIIPYSFLKDNKNTELIKNISAYNVYQEYQKEAVFPLEKDFKYGNGFQAIHYTANGDASDWMLHERGIISFSPEIGSDAKHNDGSQTFYPKKSSYTPTLQECFSPINTMIRKVDFIPD